MKLPAAAWQGFFWQAIGDLICAWNHMQRGCLRDTSSGRELGALCATHERDTVVAAWLLA